MTLFTKETRRFLKVLIQTVFTPVVTSLLYLLVFRQVLDAHVQPLPGITYSAFLVPGLIMMALVQNAFANSSSSLIQSKYTGNIIFILLAPLSPWEIYLAFALAALTRGLLVGLGVWLIALLLVDLPLIHPLWALVFAVLGGGLLGALGFMAGVWADNFDRLAAFQNFIVLPFSFLSGVFYSLADLPPLWRELSALNPFFYLVDGFRYGFLGVSDTDPLLSAGVCSVATLLASVICLTMLHTGYKIRG